MKYLALAAALALPTLAHSAPLCDKLGFAGLLASSHDSPESH